MTKSSFFTPEKNAPVWSKAETFILISSVKTFSASSSPGTGVGRGFVLPDCACAKIVKARKTAENSRKNLIRASVIKPLETFQCSFYDAAFFEYFAFWTRKDL